MLTIRTLLFTIGLFLLSATTVFAQLDYYRIPSSLVYPEMYVPQKIVYVKNLKDMQQQIAKNSPTPQAYIVGISQTPNLSNYTLSQLPEISVTKVNNSRYLLSVDNATQNFVLVFNENYNGGWQLMTSPYSQACSGSVTSYQKFNISWCNQQQNYNPLDVFSDLFVNKPIQAAHFEINGLGNAWLIHPTSSHMEILMNFVVQDYFYVGLMLSLSTVVISVVYLFFSKK